MTPGFGVLFAAGGLDALSTLHLFIALCVLLGCARMLGEVARAFRLPAVTGETAAAGILLGKTVLEQLSPTVTRMEQIAPGVTASVTHLGLYDQLFTQGSVPIALDVFRTIAVVLVLLVAGLEVDLSTVWRQGKNALIVGFAGIAVPFALGGMLGWFGDPSWIGSKAPALLLSLFLGTALSISALPVISRILMDLRLYRTDMGMLVMSAAMFNDIAGWLIFAVILSMMPAAGSSGAAGVPTDLPRTILLTVLFVAATLTILRWMVHRALPWVQSRLSWPGGVLSFTFVLAFAGAAMTQAIGIGAIFGAFLTGIAIGDSHHLREKTREIIMQFVTNVFAPVFFATVALKVNFYTDFSFSLVVVVFVIACAGKILGCGVAARWCGIPEREAWATGLALNARGAMEIILGGLALEAKVIDEKLFVALVVMAVGTSIIAGLTIESLLQRKKPFNLVAAVNSQVFIPRMKALTSREAIEELAPMLAQKTGIPTKQLAEAAWEREELMSTALGDGIAVPHARIKGARTPTLAVGLSQGGVDFNALDGKPARAIFMIVTPQHDNSVQLDMLAAIGKAMQDERIRRLAFEAKTLNEFLSALNIAAESHP